MSPDRPMLGIALMLGFCLFIPLSDALAKELGEVLPLAVLLLARFAAQPLILAPVAMSQGARFRQSRRVLRLTAVRAVLQVAGLALMFAGVSHLLGEAWEVALTVAGVSILMLAHVRNLLGVHRHG